MKKLGIILDSFSGASKKEINDLGFEFIAQIVFMNKKTYKDGEDIHAKDIIKSINTIKDFKTSLPAIGDITNLYKKTSKKYENVIFITMQKGISSTFSVAAAAAKEFQNINVISTSLISSSIIDIAQRAIKMSDDGKDLSTILAYIETMSQKSFAYVVPKDLQRIINSGRLTGIKKLIMRKAKLIPKLLLADNGFEVKGISRNFAKTCKSIAQKIIEEIGGIEKAKKYYWEVITTGDENTTQLAQNGITTFGINKIKVAFASVCVIGHTGVGAIGITAWPKK